MAHDVVIVGAGIIGLASAYYLAQGGARVVVLERSAPGTGASGAAAGMLTPHLEAGADQAFLDLSVRSRDLWPDFAAALQAHSGIDPELIAAGVVKVAESEAQAAALRQLVALQNAAGKPTEYLSPEALAELAPGLGVANFGGLHAPQDMQVEPPRVMAALQVACTNLGVDVRCGEEVRGLQVTGSRVTGVETARGIEAAGTVVLAAGTWSGALCRPGLRIPVHPVKGQIVAVRAAGRVRGPWVGALKPFWGPGCYCVPKRDGRMLLGATMEPEAGFDAAPTLGAALTVGGAAAAVFPALRAAPVLGAWAGLRPGTPDHMPLLGPVPGWEGLILATGHHRHGILLAPLSGQAVAAWAGGRRPEGDFGLCCPGRFNENTLQL